MPSTVVHVAIGGILAVGLLGREFDRRSVLVVLGAAALPDLDTILGIWIQGGHRAVLHNLVLPTAVGVALVVDARDPDGVVRGRYGERGVRIAWVALSAFVVAGVLPDLMVNGVNVFYPVHDRFYTLDGKLVLSDQRGIVQTFVELGSKGDTVGGTTANTHYYTGVDPSAGATDPSTERLFPIATSGFRLLVVGIGGFLLAARFRERQR